MIKNKSQIGTEDEKEFVGKELTYFAPKEDTLRINGVISYKEGLRAWGVIQLRKKLIDDVFPQLKERRGSFGYTMYYNRSHKEIKKLMENLEKRDLKPILLLVGRVKENKPSG